MGTAITLFCCGLIVPLSMLLFGVLMLRRPPKEIGGLFGYRTRRSMKNQQTWDFAHHLCGKIWTIVGAVMLVVCTLVQILFLRIDPDRLTSLTEILSYAQIAVLLLSILPVERALKKRFDDNGDPK